jgi:uncharacterized Zn finger protein
MLVCPECGKGPVFVTLLGYGKESRDENRARCENCGAIGTKCDWELIEWLRTAVLKARRNDNA